MYKVGFTGTQRGMTPAQRLMFEAVIAKLDSLGISEFHHGDCIGSDKEAHEAVSTLSAFFKSSVKIILHPPNKRSKRAFCSADELRKPLSYLDRNQEIVNSTDVLIATPAEEVEVLRSGTWSTIRRARKQNKIILIINPCGECSESELI
jgi:hypothetical protein